MTSPTSGAPQNPEEGRRWIAQQIRSAVAGGAGDILREKRSVDGLRGAVLYAEKYGEEAILKMHGSITPAIACRSGCPWCCYQTVTLSVAEVLRVVAEIQLMPEEQREATVARLRKLDHETRRMTNRMRDSMHLPCALLDREGRCTVYEGRPLACREVTSFNVKHCERSFKFGLSNLPIVGDAATAFSFRGVLAGLMDALESASGGKNVYPLELTAAVLIAVDTPDCFDRWLAGEDVFRAAQWIPTEKDMENAARSFRVASWPRKETPP